ncbi:hypothetical protein [Clostridium vincentii]|uniref:Uncharacterized protein n=1 Tax=Clostridium vincentii TaxID=52704 RepID=A0A2T0B6P8_9CLOT|nr:hypothetical protein [Clostridium vincentii]PRR79578.1 hypothetical protein CLVI_33300 [Clostridium vincentii]
MEYENEKENKVGAGILTICIIHFIVGGLGLLLGGIGMFALASDQITTILIISMIIVLVLIVSCIMLLCKQKVGIFLYFFATIVNLIINIIAGSELYSIGLSLILPVLMAIFISKKKELYGFGTK